MAVLITCKFDGDPIKIECIIDRTRSNMGFFSTQGQVSLWENFSLLKGKFWFDFCYTALQHI